ncbi:MAG: hypothetical protein ACKV2V_13705 [Blastocatellia bacterium]
MTGLRVAGLHMLLLAAACAQNAPAPVVAPAVPEELSAAEFARMTSEFSEPGGDFLSDNLISNETAYPMLAAKLKTLNVSGGAYIGVGPEQNFTWIARIRPRMAFIVDIRRLAAVHHLLYKALFHMSPDRAAFLSRWLSRPLPPKEAKEAVKTENAPQAKATILSPNATVGELMVYFSNTPADEKLYAETLAAAQKMIQEEFRIPLSVVDKKEIEYLLRNFQNEGLAISFKLYGGWSPGYFPTLGEVLAATDYAGNTAGFLGSAADYEYVREMQRKNLIIPVTGNFAGTQALAAIANYLRARKLPVSAFYLSNVEQYLFEDGSFGAFAENVKKLPVTENSVFIRSVLDRYGHPAHIGGHLFTMLLQKMPVFTQDFEAGKYKYYYQMVTTNYIGAAGR